MEKELEFRGHKYTSDGEFIYCDGVKTETRILNPIKSIEPISALKVDNYIYYEGQYYTPTYPLTP